MAGLRIPSGQKFKQGVRPPLIVAARLVGMGLAARVGAPQPVRARLQGLAHLAVGDPVQLGVQDSHVFDGVPIAVRLAPGPLPAQLLLPPVSAVVRRPLPGPLAEIVRRGPGRLRQQPLVPVHPFGPALPGGVGQRSRVVQGDLTRRQLGPGVGHLRQARRRFGEGLGLIAGHPHLLPQDLGRFPLALRPGQTQGDGGFQRRQAGLDPLHLPRQLLHLLPGTGAGYLLAQDGQTRPDELGGFPQPLGIGNPLHTPQGNRGV